jgi:hypothetical protein
MIMIKIMYVAVLALMDFPSKQLFLKELTLKGISDDGFII